MTSGHRWDAFTTDRAIQGDSHRAPLSCQVPKLKDTKISLRGDLSDCSAIMPHSLSDYSIRRNSYLEPCLFPANPLFYRLIERFIIF